VKRRKPFLRLSLFSAPFPAELARTVCRVPPALLTRFAEANLLERRGDTYALLDVVRAAAWRQVPTATKHQLRKRLARQCDAWLIQRSITPSERHPLFASAAEARPFLSIALDWTLQQPPEMERFWLIDHLRLTGFHDIAERAVPYLDRTCEDGNLPENLRISAANIAGHILLNGCDFEGAILRLEHALSLPLAEQEEATSAYLCSILATACHYAGRSEAAIPLLERAIAYHRKACQPMGVSGCLRFLGEIQNHLGDYERALAACEEAVRIRRAENARWSSVADGLFWKGVTLLRLGRPVEAAACIEEALALWQEEGDSTGVGHCLRLMGTLRSDQGRFAEARAHLEHALLLHERAGDQGSRIAALSVLGDVFLKVKRFPEAQARYEECLRYYEAGLESGAAAKIRARLKDCTAEATR
jgi:tetratricopeptide (TPR) repeat protein